jgi:sigma-B regulation protein RsbU (phosphoserine phosphatase)
MKILIAEDEIISRMILENTLKKYGHDVIVTCNGVEAWQALQSENAPKLVILDWMMPEMDGLELCRKIRNESCNQLIYIILLTAKLQKEDVIEGLRAGADDYVSKPFDSDELCARVQAGIRIIELQESLTTRVKELEDALSKVKQLQGLLPICCYCKKIRDDENYWNQVEEYVTKHTEVQFSHGICPECYEKHIVPQLATFVSHKQNKVGS